MPITVDSGFDRSLPPLASTALPQPFVLDAAPRARRARAVTLTEHGAATLAASQQAARQVATDLLAHMPTADREHLIALLTDFTAPRRDDHNR